MSWLRPVVRRLLTVLGAGGYAGRFALAGATAYLDVLTVAAAVAARRSGVHSTSDGEPRQLAVLVPAHNEAQLVGDTVASLVTQHYPAGRMAIHVVADNCTDETAAIAAAHGAVVHERTAPDDPGKGPALEWLIDRVRRLEPQPDAYVFIDADTTAAPGFLTAVDTALRDVQVVQGNYAVRDETSSPLIAFRAAALALRNFVRPLGRTAIGGSAGLYGNGMAFRRDAMGAQRWSGHLTEDLELSLELLLDGCLVGFAPGAGVRGEMPATLEAATTQNQRWEGGRLQLASAYVPRLLRRTVGGGEARRIAYADAALDLLVPPLSVLVGGTTVWGAMSVARSAVTRGRSGRADVIAAALVAGGQTVAVLGSLRLAGSPPAVYRALLGAPRFVAWKIGLWLRSLAGRSTTDWVRTARN